MTPWCKFERLSSLTESKEHRISVNVSYIQGKYNLYFLPPANEVCEGYVFTGVCLSTGGRAWLLARGRTWLLPGGACVVARGRAWLLQGACVVAPGGHVWLLPGGGGHAWLLGGHAWFFR